VYETEAGRSNSTGCYDATGREARNIAKQVAVLRPSDMSNGGTRLKGQNMLLKHLREIMIEAC